MPNFRHRLTRTQQRIYDRSNSSSAVPLRASPRLRHAVTALPGILHSADAPRIERAAQVIADEIVAALRVAPLRVIVQGTRPANARSELHGLYTARNGQRATIKVWMRTAKRGQVVAFKTFLRTLLHEVCHHLDYTLLRLPDSFHTEGFYQRESSLFYRVGGADAAAAASLTAPQARRPQPPLAERV